MHKIALWLVKSTLIQGFTTEVYYHDIHVVSEKLSYEDVLIMAGETIAKFCKDYTTVLGRATPRSNTGQCFTYMYTRLGS